MVEGVKLNKPKLKENIERSVMMVTALSPIIGYDQAAVISNYAIDHDLTLKEAALATRSMRSCMTVSATRSPSLRVVQPTWPPTGRGVEMAVMTNASATGREFARTSTRPGSPGSLQRILTASDQNRSHSCQPPLQT
jgi:hypothetical protein